MEYSVSLVSLPRAVLLDLDDTILDDSGNVSSCWLEACRAHCSDAGLDPESVFESIERTRHWFWSDPERHRIGRLDLGAARREVVRLALADIGAGDGALADPIGDTYHRIRVDGIQPIADAIAALQKTPFLGERRG